MFRPASTLLVTRTTANEEICADKQVMNPKSNSLFRNTAPFSIRLLAEIRSLKYEVITQELYVERIWDKVNFFLISASCNANILSSVLFILFLKHRTKYTNHSVFYWK